ncbi:g779 [Coccomyxa elongata]
MATSFMAKTVQCGSVRNCIEDIKDIIADGNFILAPEGITLLAMDPSSTVLVNLKLEAENFEVYACEKRQVIGVNMSDLFKIIKTMTNDDTLTLFIETDNPNYLFIRIENQEKHKVTTYKFNLMDLNEDEVSLPPAHFESVINMPSVDFQKITRDMHNIGDIIEIKSIGQQLILSCKGDFASQETVIGNNVSQLSAAAQESLEASGSAGAAADNQTIVQGFYTLKYLTQFSKCSNLSSQCELYLKNDYPLILAYKVANLGTIRLMLAPHVEDQKIAV